LDIRNNKNLSESVKSFVEIEPLIGDNQYSCDSHKIDATRYSIIEKTPEVLVLHLKRFGYNLKTGRRYKVNDRFEFPTVVDLTDYLTERIHMSHELKELVLHSGKAESRHYTSLVFIHGNG
jgi:ubiquitin C-terminal hydrolase